jgi:hypothetical protein
MLGPPGLVHLTIRRRWSLIVIQSTGHPAPRGKEQVARKSWLDWSSSRETPHTRSPREPNSRFGYALVGFPRTNRSATARTNVRATNRPAIPSSTTIRDAYPHRNHEGVEFGRRLRTLPSPNFPAIPASKRPRSQRSRELPDTTRMVRNCACARSESDPRSR